MTRDPPEKASHVAASVVLHELQVHQVELEMQNEELRRSQHALEMSHQRFTDLYDFAPVGYLTTSVKGVIQEANLTAASLLGVERKKLNGRPFSGLVSDEDADRWNRFLGSLARQKPEQGICDLVLRRGDGATFDAHLVCLVTEGRPDMVSEVRITLSDVTESRHLEKALRETKARLSLVIDSTDDGYTDWDVPGGRVKYSRRFATMLGYDLSDLDPDVSTWERLVHPDDRQRAWDDAQPHLRGETERYECEERLRHKDGRWIWTLLRGKVVERDATGRPLRMVGTHSDISGRKAVEDRLIASEARFRALAEGAPVGIFETDAEGRNVYINAAGAGILGQASDKVRGTGWRSAIHPDDVDRVMEEWSRSVADGKTFSSRYRVRRPDGTVLVVHGFGDAVRSPDRQVAGFVGVMTDITRHVALEDQLALTARLAAMGTLVAGLAHEINNPLTAEMAGQGLALEVARQARKQLLDGAPLDTVNAVRELDGVIEALEDALAGGERVARIVRDMAAFARPDRKSARTHLRDAVDGALRWLSRPLLQGAEVVIDDQGAPDVDATPGQIGQLTTNLVTNALMATRAGTTGKVTVRLRSGDGGCAILEVIDRGTGIPAEIRQRIFDPFYTTRPVGPGRGTGMGLAICQAIVTSHGGSLTFESEVGKGSTFRVELPSIPAEA